MEKEKIIKEKNGFWPCRWSAGPDKEMLAGSDGPSFAASLGDAVILAAGILLRQTRLTPPLTLCYSINPKPLFCPLSPCLGNPFPFVCL